MRDVFGEALCELGARNERLIVVDADVGHATRAHRFQAQYPERYVQLGVAEQNVVAFSAGLATLGYVPVANLFATFATKRACDQVSISVAWPRLNVKICGCYGGITTPNTGATHQSVEDVAVMRAMPNMTVVEAADALELRQALAAVVDYEGPVYLRVVRCELPDVLPPDYRFALGKGVVLREGGDLTLIGSGLMTSRCVEAAERFSREGISARVINMPTLKPIDEEMIVEAASKTGGIVTAENHSVIGGLGSAVCEVLADQCPVPVKRVGIQDTFGTSGKLDGLLRKFGLTADAVFEAGRQVLRRQEN